MPKTNILVVSDTHVGSIYGLMPPGFKASDDREVLLNPGQQYLWECWEDMIRWAKPYSVAAIIHNGDVIDGKQQAQRGTELCLPIPADQAEAAEMAFAPLLKAAGNPSIYLIQGTEYHDAKGAREMEAFGKAIGAVQHRGLGTGRYSRDGLDLEIDGVVLNFAHHISGGGGFYRATAADREGVLSALAGKEGKLPKADAVFRSHLHYFVRVEHESKHICITPCWQLQTRFMRKLSTYKCLPSIGAVMVTVDPDAKREGLDPIHIAKRLYPLPAVKTTKLR